MQAATNTRAKSAPGGLTDSLAKLSELAMEARMGFALPHWLLEDVSEPDGWEQPRRFRPSVQPEIPTADAARIWVQVRPNIPEWAAGRLHLGAPSMAWNPPEHEAAPVELGAVELAPASVSPISPWDCEQLLLRDAESWGPWPELPVYSLDLERLDHEDPDFLTLLEAELWVRSRHHWDQGGFAVHLHAAGDFYDFDYVRFWAEAIDRIPGVRAFGATTRLPDAEDETARIIGVSLKRLTDAVPDHLAIRFHSPAGATESHLLEPPAPQHPAR